MTEINALLSSIKHDMASGNTASLFNTLETLDRNELTTFFRCWSKVSEADGKVPTLAAIAGIYDEIAPFVRKAFDRNEISKSDLFIEALDAISTLRVYSEIPDCYSDNHPAFVVRNGLYFPFWRWFRAHMPADIKALSFDNLENSFAGIVLFRILISRPHDLRFYKEFCLDFESRNPVEYARLCLDPWLRDVIVETAIAKAEGKTLPRRSVPMWMVKNNFLIADFLR